jgi:PAS domain S-box-containing protein
MRDQDKTKEQLINELASTRRQLTQTEMSWDALRKSERAFRVAFENSQDAIIWANPRTGIVVNCNRSAERLFEQARDEIIGAPMARLYPADKAQHYFDAFVQSVKRPSAPEFDSEIVARTGAIKAVRVRAAATTTVDDQPIIQGMLRDVTEEQRLDLEIRETRSQLEEVRKARLLLDTIVQNLPSAVYLKDASALRFELWNRAAERLFGLPNHEVIGRGDNDLFTLEQADAFAASDRQALVTGAHVEIAEETVETRSQGKRTLATRKIVIQDLSGRPEFVLGVSEDITERKRTEELLHRARAELEKRVEERTADLSKANGRLSLEIKERRQAENNALAQRDLAAALASVSDRETAYRLGLEAALRIYDIDCAAIAVLNDDSTFRMQEYLGPLSTSRLASELCTCVKPNFPAGAALRGIPCYVGREALPSDLEELLQNEKLGFFAAAPIKKEGRVIACLGVGSMTAEDFPVSTRNALETIAAQIGTAVARFEAEEALGASEERYRVLVENSLTGLLMQQGGKIVYLNQRLAWMLGCTAGEVVGWEFAELIEAEDRPAAIEALAERVGRDRPEPAAFRLVRRDGGVRWVEALASPIEYLGVNAGMISLMDITDRVRAEEEIRTLNMELEQRVIERTAQLEASNNELREFAYVTSHDLKSPVRAARQLAGWLASDHAASMNDEAREMLNTLLGRVDRMDRLIDALLEYSRIGRVKEHERDVDLDQLVRDICRRMVPSGRFNVRFETKLPTLKFEYTRAEQLFGNLIDNAVKFMDKPNGEISIGCQADGGAWTFSIADNGPGIDESYHEKIFRIFQTLAPRDEVESTGIGLTLAKKIVDTCNGRIWVESESGKGSTFFVTFPPRGEP